MQLLSEIRISRPAGDAVLQLLEGDLSAIPKQHEADILVVSAFPNDYTALPGSLMRALLDKGVDVGVLSNNKAVDLVQQLGCWLSQPLSPELQQQMNFKQILCFEPSRQSGSPETVVGNIFRCINNFVFDDHNNDIAMPVLATGRQKISMETMLPAMLDACLFWMDSGIPLNSIKLFVHGQAQMDIALPIFEKARQAHEAAQAQQSAQEPIPATTGAKGAPMRGFTGGGAPRALAPAGTTTSPVSTATAPAAQQPPAPFDYFISYSHVYGQQVAELVAAMKAKDPNLNIFYDRSSIPTGGLWIKIISDAIQRSKYVVCILSPEYRNSDVCWDEFQCAKAKEYKLKQSVIKTINFIKDTDMPLIMSLYSYIDCTEGDIAKLKEAVQQLC